MEIARKIKAIIKKYPYVGINKPTLIQKREIGISYILGIKNKSKFNYFYTCKNDSIEFKNRMEVFNYFFKLDMTEEEIIDVWCSMRNENYVSKGIYNHMPKKQRKDNANPDTYGLNYGSGYGGNSSIRVPSKKRKNKWKNFKKLFPKYCEDNNIK
jgi:hypothetical protein